MKAAMPVGCGGFSFPLQSADDRVEKWCPRCCHWVIWDLFHMFAASEWGRLFYHVHHQSPNQFQCYDHGRVFEFLGAAFLIGHVIDEASIIHDNIANKAASLNPSVDATPTFPCRYRCSTECLSLSSPSRLRLDLGSTWGGSEDPMHLSWVLAFSFSSGV